VRFRAFNYQKKKGDTHMKRPNGYGSIVNLGKNRRKPYAVRVMDRDKSYTPNPDGSYTRKYTYIGYYEKKADAQEALDQFNAAKTPPSYARMTFADIWQIWADRNLHGKSESRAVVYTAAYKKCAPLYNRAIVDIRLADLQNVIDAYPDGSRSTLNNIKIVMSFVFEWAIKNDIVDKDYSQFVEISARKQVNHAPLTHQQVDNLIAQNSPEICAKMAIVYLYTGCRLSELLELDKNDVHLQEQYMHIRKAKTAAGVRLVPIADKIAPIIAEFMQAPGKTLFNASKKDYISYFKNAFNGLTPHSTRSTFISFLTEKDVPQIIIQKIVGHATGNVTGDVYTRLSLQPLLDAVNKL
jgi:integrase